MNCPANHTRVGNNLNDDTFHVNIEDLLNFLLAIVVEHQLSLVLTLNLKLLRDVLAPGSHDDIRQEIEAEESHRLHTRLEAIVKDHRNHC